MARSSDVVGFTRIFVLFCTLVLLPAMLLSGFGVIAILNERAADKGRRLEEAEIKLRAAEEKFVAIVESTDRTMRTRLTPPWSDDGARRVVQELRGEGRPVGPFAVLSRDGAPIAGEPPFTSEEASARELRERFARVAASAPADEAAHVPTSSSTFAGVVSLQRLPDDRVLAYAVDAEAVDRALRAASGDRGMSASLRAPTERGDTPVVGALDRLLSEVQRLPSPDDTEELATRRLTGPFERWTVAVTAPPSSTAKTTVVVYLVLILVFYATLITGVVITARLIWKETRLSRLKTDFVSHVSHELRTPLTSIRMFIETLKLGRARSAEEQQECLDLLAKETERLSEMIERVLGYARLRAGRRPFRVEALDVDSVVDEAIAAFRAQTLHDSSAQLVLSKQLEPGLPAVSADRDALVEALLNLIGNAYKYTGPDKRIVVFAKRDRKRVVVAVQDNGPGLPPSEQKRIFERFYQAGSGLLSKQTTGSGLGLAITRAIVEGQGGRIHVESEPGKGATFIVALRAAV